MTQPGAMMQCTASKEVYAMLVCETAPHIANKAGHCPASIANIADRARARSNSTANSSVIISC